MPLFAIGSKDDSKERSKEPTHSSEVVTEKGSIPLFPLAATVSPAILPTLKKPKGRTNIPLGVKLKGRWTLKSMIGEGGYGEVYYGVDETTGDMVAVKVEPTHRKGKPALRNILEQKVLQRLQGRAHCPMIYASGIEMDGRKGPVNYIVMQLLSINVGDMRKLCPHKRLSKSTVGRIILQAIAGLRDLHQIGYLHRDIKPANMCFGITQYSRHRLFLVDYGMVRRFRSEDGIPRMARKWAGFRGTVRYVSIRVHDRIEQCPADDLISLAYSALELIVGELPWKNTNKSTDVREAKIDMYMDDLTYCHSLVGEYFRDFFRASYSMNFDEQPNYDLLQKMVWGMVGNTKISDQYDWENGFEDVFNFN